MINIEYISSFIYNKNNTLHIFCSSDVKKVHYVQFLKKKAV